MNTMRKLVGAVLGVTMVALGGCAVTAQDCDPTNRDASLIRKAACDSSGVYSGRVVELEKLVLDEQKMNVMFRDVYNAVEKEKSEVSKELKGKRTEYAALTNSLNALLGELKTKAKGNQAIEKEIADLTKELEDIKNQDSPAVMQKQVELDQLKNKVVDLEQQLGLR